MIKLPIDITKFMQVFRKNKYQIYLVGGAVRNLLLNTSTDNWDFTTNATPEEILKMFPDSFYNNVYGTVTVPQKPLLLEVTPFRLESDYIDNRHPEKIAWAKTLEEDLARRDFTINAIAFDGEKIIDPYHGQDDLKNKIIRAVGDANKRFNEDALRLMRAIRLTSQLSFLIEEKTRLAISKKSNLIKNVSWERIRDELLKIIGSDHPDDGIRFLHNTGLLQHILPELEICFTVPQKSPKRHHIYDVGMHSVMALKHCPSKNPITRFATLLHDIGKAKTFKKDSQTNIITFYNHEVVGTWMVEKIADRLRLSNKDKERLVCLVKYHQFTVSEIQTDKAVRRFIREVGKEYLQDILDLRTGDRIGSGATPTSWRYELFKKRLDEVQKEPFKVTDLKINGNDIMKELKIKPGPQIGKILNEIFNQVINQKVKNQRKDLIGLLKNTSITLVN